jgi:outer membrane lipoprotein SlyB
LNGTYGSYIPLLSKATDPIGKLLGKTIGKTIGKLLGKTIGKTIGKLIGKTIGKTIGKHSSAVGELCLMCDGSDLVSVVLQHPTHHHIYH